MLVDHNLAEETPIEVYRKIEFDSIFIGSIIRHLYDEQRISLKPLSQNEPTRLSFKPQDTNHTTYLYGYLYKPKGLDTFLINKLKKYTVLDSLSYNKILQEFNYTCTDNTINLGSGMYPIDTVHIKKYIPEYSYQETIDFKEDLPNFQQFTTIHMILIVPEGRGLNTIL